MTTIVYLGLIAYILGAWYGIRRANAKTAGGLPSKFWLYAAGSLVGGLLIDRANTFFNENVGALLSKGAGLMSQSPTVFALFFAFFATGALVTAFFSWSCFGYLIGLLDARLNAYRKAKADAAAEKAALAAPVEEPAAPAGESTAS